MLVPIHGKVHDSLYSVESMVPDQVIANGPQEEESQNKPLLTISFDKLFAPCTAFLPLGSILFCFITAVIFQFDQVNVTFCPVSVAILMYFNFIKILFTIDMQYMTVP